MNKNRALIIMSEADVAVIGTRSPQRPVQETCSFSIRRQDEKRVVVAATVKQEGIKNGKAFASLVKRKRDNP
jgi:hypothetical protein